MALPFSIIFYRNDVKKREAARLKEIKKQFADALASTAGAMNAGYSVENAFAESYSDMKTMYGNDSEIVRDLHVIINKLKINQSIEEVLLEFAAKKNIEEISYLSDVVNITKKTGGNLSQVMKGTKDIIYEKEDLDRQIDIVVSSKKYETLIMEIMPLGIIMYLRVFSPEFINVLYGNIRGVLIMTIVLLAYGGFAYLAERMSQVDV